MRSPQRKPEDVGVHQDLAHQPPQGVRAVAHGRAAGLAPDLGTTQGVLGVWALKSGHGMLYVGGDFTLVNGAQQNRFAMFHSVHG